MEVISAQDKQWVNLITQHLATGAVLVYPTETTYGLGCDVDNAKSLDALYLIKERDGGKPIHVLVANTGAAQKLVLWPTAAQQLARDFWPGPLTLVLPLRTDAPSWASRLSVNSGYLGVRVSSQPLVQQLLAQWHKPLPATSANISGQANCYAVGDVQQQFAGKSIAPDFALDAGMLEANAPSTIVRITEAGEVAVLREGPITEADIKTKLT